MKPQILIVDDDPVNQLTLEAILGDEDYALSFAADGTEGLAAARRIRPDLVLLDVMMPGLDGFAVCQAIRSDPEIARMPIIMVTALDDFGSRVKGLRCGADDFLTKPFQREELRARVSTVATLNRFRTIENQRHHLESVVSLAPAAILVVDGEGRVTSANRLAESCFGPMAGRPLRECMDNRALPAVAGAIDDAASAHEPEIPRQIEIIDSTGATRWFSVRASLLPSGGPGANLVVFADITAETRARRDLEEVNRNLDGLVRARTAELEEANSLLMSYASFVSHDLRSPLTVMKGMLSLITGGVAPVTGDAARFVKMSYDATLTMEQMITNILELARAEFSGHSVRPAPVDLKPVVQRVQMHLQTAFMRIPYELTIGPLPAVAANPALLERVFYNLIGNAIKYSSHREKPTVEVGQILHDGHPAIYVRDNGVGFDNRDADKLFQEFSRLSTGKSKEGLGLGLSLVSRLVKLGGGRIWAEGRAGEGATFFIQFPPPDAGVAAPAAADAAKSR